MVYTTLPGDLQLLDSQGMGEGMAIWRRFAVIKELDQWDQYFEDAYDFWYADDE